MFQTSSFLLLTLVQAGILFQYKMFFQHEASVFMRREIREIESIDANYFPEHITPVAFMSSYIRKQRRKIFLANPL
ncbi:hypothetical protein CHCC14821_3193 [Bacillus paralicheniformis]|nr:hypothetical protein CHCC14821_3193 [Bacillus paralicheniformis]